MTGTSSTHTAGAAPPAQREASQRDIRAFVRRHRAQVLTFVGYSGAGYEDAAAMLACADRVLAAHDPATTLVNIGATAEGIGAAYELAKRRGFTTIGIVSTQARDGAAPLSACVDHVFFVPDGSWGGLQPGSRRLAPTSAAIVAVSSVVVGIGGGEIGRDELAAARRAGRVVAFYPADMNHAAAIDKALKKGEPVPTDFRGAAHRVGVSR